MVDVLLFAELQEATGKDKIAVEAAGMTVAELKKNFVAQYHMEYMVYFMVVGNGEYACDVAVIYEGYVVAFIPPVSGGFFIIYIFRSYAEISFEWIVVARLGADVAQRKTV